MSDLAVGGGFLFFELVAWETNDLETFGVVLVVQLLEACVGAMLLSVLYGTKEQRGSKKGQEKSQK